MQSKNGCFLVTGFFGIILVGGVISALNQPPPGPPATKTALTAAAQDQLDGNQTPTRLADQTWQATYGGHTVECGIQGGAQYYIIMPSIDEMNAGAQPQLNAAPSADSWMVACGPAYPGPVKGKDYPNSGQ